MNENCFSNFCEFRLISEGVTSAPTVYSELESVAKLIFSFVPRSFFFFEISEKLTFEGRLFERGCDRSVELSHIIFYERMIV